MAVSFIQVIVALALAQTPAPASQPESPTNNALAKLRLESEALMPLIKTPWVKQFAAGVTRLPVIGLRKVYEDEKERKFYNHNQFYSFSTMYQNKLIPNKLNDFDYYYTRYGTPLAYARPLDILGQHGLKTVRDTKILDFGYGTIGHLRLLAQLGATAHGVDTDTRLQAMYSMEGDQGPVPNDDGSVGNLAVFAGRWPAEEAVKKEIGEGYDLFISKNTLKMGFIHPTRKADPRRLIQLGVDDAAYLKAVHSILKPGGLVMIYNLSPALSPPDKEFLPWTDGRCPFTSEQFAAAGFEVVEFEKDDSNAAREMGRALGWDKGSNPMDLKNDLFANYTIARKK